MKRLFTTHTSNFKNAHTMKNQAVENVQNLVMTNQYGNL
ncbi:hypothetical protein SMGD1_1126 [Sulfurimonas gotlandica GD1]|uniref:Uncharacterized protein n=1 Tax=Sulfurimonas gotlandica (strain DSM 19862 / JCM 16533 / GD1) TaxID=929558 RepID=H1FYV5_SULGG|nr:hypothetical protein SMGD1_1126 [Sulfurimonas gotlandica GD1]